MKNLIYLTLIMAISCKKDQPIPFEDDFNCQPCASSYCVPVQSGDTSQIQVDLTALSDNLITNGTFASGSGWTIVGSWTISGGVATGTSGSLSRDTNIDILAGYYKVEFDLTVTDDGIIDVLLAGNNILSTGVIIANAQHITIFNYISIPSGNEFQIALDAGAEVIIDNVEIYKLSSIQYTIQDCETEEVFYEDTTNVGIEYFETSAPNLDEPVIVYTPITTAYAIITLDWDGMGLDTDQCYCICIKDKGLIGYEYIRNGNFATSDFWTIANTGAGWSISAGEAKHVNLGGAGDDILSQELLTALSADMCYILTFDFDAATSWNVTITGDTATTSGIGIAALAGSASAGTQTVSIPAGYAFTDIHFASDNVSLWDMDNVSIKPDPDCVPCTTSNCISLKESWDTFCSVRKMCNILITGTNTYSAFGFASNYDFKGRVFGMIRNSSYPDVENVEYKDLTGLKSLQYNDNEKTKELQIFAVPEVAHDWIRLALRCETLTLTINSTAKTFIKKGGDYTPNWSKLSPDASVIVEIQEVQQVSSMSRNV